MTNPEIIQPSNPVLLFFQEVKEGDLRKFNDESNDSPTGGGARDLRIRRESEFWTPMAPFFPKVVSPRERRGVILSQTSTTTPPQAATISFMGATDARPGECRICKIGKISGWDIGPDQFKAAKAAGNDWFYLLALDDAGNVWASKFSSEVLDEMHVSVQTAVKSARARLGGRTIRGLLNIAPPKTT